MVPGLQAISHETIWHLSARPVRWYACSCLGGEIEFYDLLPKHLSVKLPFDLPPYVFAHYRQGLWTAFNYTDKPVTLPLPEGAKILMGQAVLSPAGVLDWKD